MHERCLCNGAGRREGERAEQRDADEVEATVPGNQLIRSEKISFFFFFFITYLLGTF